MRRICAGTMRRRQQGPRRPGARPRRARRSSRSAIRVTIPAEYRFSGVSTRSSISANSMIRSRRASSPCGRIAGSPPGGRRSRDRSARDGCRPATSMSARDPPVDLTPSSGRLGDAGDHLEQSRLARPVVTDDPERRTAGEGDGDIVERIERVLRPPAGERPRDHPVEGARKGLADPRPADPDAVGLRDPADLGGKLSDRIGEPALGRAEVRDARREHHDRPDQRRGRAARSSAGDRITKTSRNASTIPVIGFAR